ncbi:hypothetical protein A3H87_04870 [Candidatus Curtissbacteria bacterium RIFCSPLOWO2_02_FULL_42_37]|uniref:Uncharacterized protein n=1 Tax=Candidatus Curtissbacteria bacterium RIFCSPLOWO2_01_FULL_42_50 TaxID=1797730 RepID=A0A1F5H412_9BACT|nr:MAG: hypothetical protein A3E71_01620 [Candidatus Curtissbacteria bacterium RIFCSPHIGHO2_12_FULL_42_33]OGD98828.1 MAG: hypothetical protein A3B54_01630 [Candidatus Curtissbacteria bacterium RIFCSPLOWO2_01_FULL_42_50]OGE03240.1 MAG: hypothetical protein A3G16_01675 [Candidatus Curtissbacteria bacterium RIFCSPLOWO2_12_FULL_41_16]OGE11664.1 MAG: hypothetical protein A3H87_04870 [Candidatus Curtissbacteria bacterium RIFCSPLOWO2_02_FULL_42_37]
MSEVEWLLKPYNTGPKRIIKYIVRNNITINISTNYTVINDNTWMKLKLFKINFINKKIYRCRFIVADTG